MRTRAGAAAICLLLLGGCASSVSNNTASEHRPSPSSAATAAGPSALVGVTCRFTEVIYKGRHYPIPLGLDGRVRLSGDGTYTMNDSVNTESGHWDDTPDGFRVIEWGGSDVGMPAFQPDAPNASPQGVLSNALTKLQRADDVAVAEAGPSIALTASDFTFLCSTST